MAYLTKRLESRADFLERSCDLLGWSQFTIKNEKGEKAKRREIAESRLDEIYLIMDGLKNRPLIYDNELIRKILECVVVISKEKIKVVFKGGLEIEQELEDEKVA